MEKDRQFDTQQIKIGFKKSHSVINRLILDAELLLKNGRYSSSVALAILAFEELSKADLLRVKIIRNEKLSLKEWEKMVKGRESHQIKLSYLIEKKEKKVEQKWSDFDIQFLNAANKKLGFISYGDRNSVRNDIQVLKKILPKLNLVKQDCFYLNWNFKQKKWLNFDNRFSDKIKKAIATYLILETKQILLLQKFTFELKDRLLVQLTEEDWLKLKNSKVCKQIIIIQKEIQKRTIKGEIPLAITALSNYD